MQKPEQQRAQERAELRTVQVIEGDESAVADVLATLRDAGCVVESVRKIASDKWEITARSDE